MLRFEDTEVCKIGHTVQLAKRLRSYTGKTRVEWCCSAALSACRRSEARMKAASAPRRIQAWQVPWEHAAAPLRQRRGRPAFSGESELRCALTQGELTEICESYARILQEEVSRH